MGWIIHALHHTLGFMEESPVQLNAENTFTLTGSNVLNTFFFFLLSKKGHTWMEIKVKKWSIFAYLKYCLLWLKKGGLTKNTFFWSSDKFANAVSFDWESFR